MNRLALVEELKKQLKKREITYAALGAKVGLSEPAIKRAFAARNFSLQRLDQFCEAIGFDLAELVLASRRGSERPRHLPLLVEEELAAHPELLHLFYLILFKTQPADMRKHLAVDKKDLYRLARRLEDLGLIEVLPAEKYRSLIRKSVRWLADGPLTKRYGQVLQQVFFQTDFKGPQEQQDFLTGVLSEESVSILKRKMDELFRQFDELSELDAQAVETSSTGFWLYAGLRPWAPLEVIRAGKR